MAAKLSGAVSEAASVRVMVTGKMKLAQTATTAARKVEMRYRTITVPNFLPIFSLDCASALMMSMNTSSGAMAFRAPTNRVPKMPMPGAVSAALGMSRARATPMTMPITMRSTRLTLLYAFTIFIFSFSFLLRFVRTIAHERQTAVPSEHFQYFNKLLTPCQLTKKTEEPHKLPGFFMVCC